MFVGKYKDFDEMFLKLNREFLLHPESIDNVIGESAYIENAIIGCRTWNCTLDLSNFGYKISKWKNLINTYINYEELLEFYEKIRTISGTSFTYYFNRKKKNNGSCLISIVLVRKKRLGKWAEAKVFYRTTETQRRMAADLVMINRFMNELPKDICEINKVVFFMSQCYCSSDFINGFFDYFGVDRNDIPYTHSWTKQIRHYYEKYYKEYKPQKYMTRDKMQRLLFGLDEYEPIPIKTLSIKEYFEGKVKK